jgi:hypothetical protein
LGAHLTLTEHMRFLEIKSPDNPARIILVNTSAISSLELTIGRGNFQIVLELNGGTTKYTWFYETHQDAENTFAKFKGELGNDISEVTI